LKILTDPEGIPDTSSDVLRKEIITQSEAEVSDIIQQSEKDAERIIQRAEQEASKIREAALRKAQAQAENVEKKILSSLKLQIQKEALRAREDLLGDIFNAVMENLERFRRTPEYVPYVKRFILEGVRALGGASGTLTVIPGSVERKILTEAMIAEIVAEADAGSDEKVKLNVSKQTADEGGVILVSENDRIRFDNRFSRRVERFKQKMRLEATRRVLE
jgi:vacuolar-type H+-ATPase subunit E/Vma4